MKKSFIGILLFSSYVTFANSIKFFNLSLFPLYATLVCENEYRIGLYIPSRVEYTLGFLPANVTQIIISGQILNNVLMPDGGFVSLTAYANSGDTINIHVDSITGSILLNNETSHNYNKEWKKLMPVGWKPGQ